MECFVIIIYYYHKALHLGCYSSPRSASERTHNPSKVAAAKNLFLQCVCYRYNLLRLMFFIPYNHWKTLCFVRNCCYVDILSTVILTLSLKQVFWRSPYFMLSAQKQGSTNTKILRLKIKLYTLLDKFLYLISRLRCLHYFILWLLSCLLINTFPYKNNIFCETFVEACFSFNRIFCSLVSFCKENKITEHLFK